MAQEVAVGASLSLSGRYALQGSQAERGLRLWAEEVNAGGGLQFGGGRHPVRLALHDDGGRAAGLETNVTRLLGVDGVDVLFGPYGSALALRAVHLAAAQGRLLWNHGGASDAVVAAAPARVVAGIPPASAYFTSLPAHLRRTIPELRRLVVLAAAPGTFGHHVAAGVVAAARENGIAEVATLPFAPPLAEDSGPMAEARAWAPQALLCAGRFEDDVWLATQRAHLGPDLAALAAVAAGLSAFGPAAGPAAEGVLGASHWEVTAPGGSGTADFAARFARAHGGAPDYPAALAYAMGLVFAACAARAGSLDEAALREAAADLDLSTPIGRFRLDPATGQQVGYRPLLVRWRHGTKEVLGEPR